MARSVESSTPGPLPVCAGAVVALDHFTGRAWKKSAVAERSEKKEKRSRILQLGTTEDVQRLTTQTFFLEPVDTPVLFGAPRVVAVQGRLPFVRVDSKERFKLDHTIKRESSISFFRYYRARSGCLTFDALEYYAPAPPLSGTSRQS